MCASVGISFSPQRGRRRSISQQTLIQRLVDILSSVDQFWQEIEGENWHLQYNVMSAIVPLKGDAEGQAGGREGSGRLSIIFLSTGPSSSSPPPSSVPVVNSLCSQRGANIRGLTKDWPEGR